MNRTLLFVSIALATAGGAFVACTSDSSPASPTVPPPTGAGDGGNGNRDTGGGTVADTGAPSEGGTSSDADAGGNVAPDGGDAAVVACPDVTDGGDAGYATVAAEWSFAVSVATLNGGKGQVLTVRKCDSVVWTNTDLGTPHSVVSNPGTAFGFSTIAKSSGALPAIQFTQAGTFGYQCGIHGTMMIGEITVQP